MKFPILPFFILLIVSFEVSAKIDPRYSEAVQRGYPVEGDSVVLPDGTKCLLDDFNRRKCGKEFFDLPYCVPEGGYVWENNKCCEGLVAYLPEGVKGQATCQKKGKIDFSETIRNPFLWLGILAFTAVFYGSLLLLKKVIRKKQTV